MTGTSKETRLRALIDAAGLSSFTCDSARYEFRRIVGIGGQGTVCEYSVGSDLVAVKMTFSTSEEHEGFLSLKREFEAMTRMSPLVERQSICKPLVSPRHAEALPVAFMATTFASGQRLDAFLEAHPPPWKTHDAIRLAWRLVLALFPAHALSFAHLDLHPGNIFVHPDEVLASIADEDSEKRGTVTVIDFGVAHDTITSLYYGRPQNQFRPAGSALFASPEVLTGVGDRGPASDVWSIGVLLWHLLAGKSGERNASNFPFFGASLHELTEQAKAGPRNETLPSLDDCDAPTKRFVTSLLKHMLEPDPRGRLRAHDARHMMFDLVATDVVHHASWTTLESLYLRNGGDISRCVLCGAIGAHRSRCVSCGSPPDEEGFLHAFPRIR